MAMNAGEDTVPVCHSPQGVFILCDNTDGFPMRYISQGFVNLFGYSREECIGKRCGRLVGGPSIKGDATAVASISESSGLSKTEVMAGIDKLTAHAGEQCRLMMESPKDRVGFSLLLNRKKNGAIFVCECLTLVLNRPELGWSYSIGMQRDVSHEVSTCGLLKALATGGYEDILRVRREEVKSRLKRVAVGGDKVVQYVYNTALSAMRSLRPSASHQGGAAFGVHGIRREASRQTKTVSMGVCRLQRIPECCGDGAGVEPMHINPTARTPLGMGEWTCPEQPMYVPLSCLQPYKAVTHHDLCSQAAR